MKLSYTVEEAARRLSLAFGEPLTDRDILQLVLYRKLPICVNFYQQLAIETAAVTMLWNWWPENVNDTTRLPEMLCANRGQRASTEETAEPRKPFHRTCTSRQSNDTCVLMGEYYVAGDCHGINDFLLWVVSGKTPSEYDKISIDGYCVLGAKGTWFEPVDINDNDTGFIPALLPRLSDFRIRSVDLEAVESKPATSGQALTAEAPMHGKERAHYLKVIAALLSKAKISKSEPVTRVLMMLEAAGQTSINRETLGKTLNDANSLRQ